MNRLKLLILTGVILLVAGFSLLAINSQPATAQDEPPDYVGTSECSDCHRDVVRQHDDTAHARTLSDDEDAILANFETGDEARTVQFPGDEAARPFTADDVAFVVGTGKYVQRYLFEVDRNEYRVLPAEWDVQAGEWRALTLAESWEDPAYDWEQSCAYCHVTGYNFERDRWEDDGVYCEACHGGGENHVEEARDAGRNPSEEELTTIRGAIQPGSDSQVCGQCHSRGTSADGRPFPVGYYPGATLTDTFTLVTLTQTDHWWASGHARQMNMQYNEWVGSAHAQNDTDCTDCHNPHSEAEFPDQLVSDGYALCVSCHNQNPAEGSPDPVQEMWEGLPVVDQVLPEPGIHYLAEEGPTCATCHTVTVPVDGGGDRVSHALQPITPTVALTETALRDSCTICHDEVSSPALMQELIDDIQVNTHTRIDTARAAITDTTPAWVITALDFVEHDGSYGIHNYAYSDALLDAVYEALNLYAAQ